MKAGMLTQIIYLYDMNITENDYGHIKTNYTQAYRTRASVKYEGGSRVIDNEEVFFPMTVSFTVRSYVPVELTSRIKYKDNFYRILSIEENHTQNNQIIKTELINE